MSRAVTKKLSVAVGVVVLVAVAGAGVWWQVTRLPKRFAPVVEGELYRSGEVTPAHLERLQEEYGIQRVISLLNPAVPESIAERQAAERLGIEWHNIPLGGDGASEPGKRDQLRELVLAEDAPPTLVHCAAGVNRTGLAVGMYRIHAQGWSYEQVLEEMLRFDFDNLPKHENLRAALQAEAASNDAVATTQPVTRGE